MSEKLKDFIYFVILMTTLVGGLGYRLTHPDPGPKCILYELGQVHNTRGSTYLGNVTIDWNLPKGFTYLNSSKVPEYTVRLRVFDEDQNIILDKATEQSGTFLFEKDIKAVEFYSQELGPCGIPTTKDKVIQIIVLFVLFFGFMVPLTLFMAIRGWIPSPWGPQRGFEKKENKSTDISNEEQDT